MDQGGQEGIHLGLKRLVPTFCKIDKDFLKKDSKSSEASFIEEGKVSSRTKPVTHLLV